jgi:hypothetical protein
VPANRSRTEKWRDSLQQIADRGGGLEFSVSKGNAAPEPNNGPDLVWRVRLVGITDTQLLLEQPVAMGNPIKFEEGMELVAVMSVGQNRWMFHTKVLGEKDPSVFGAQRGLRVAAPTSVERCSRRDFLRISTAELRLPQVQCWPLLDPASVVAAEVANRAHITDLERAAGHAEQPGSDSILLPEVGPPFSARLLNIGGGGVGLMISREETAAAERSRLIWMRINLTPHIKAPIAMTARVVHTHLDSGQNLYAGVAFDFAFNPGHREFVVDQVTRYVSRVQAKAKAA